MTPGPSRNETTGRRIAILREAAGLTQAELARRLGLTQSAVSRFESGTRSLSLQQAAAAAAILGVSPADLAAPPAEGPPAPYRTANAPALRRARLSEPSELWARAIVDEDEAPRRRPESGSRDFSMARGEPAPDDLALLFAEALPARPMRVNAPAGAPADGMRDEGLLPGPSLLGRALEPAAFDAVVADWFDVARRAPALLALPASAQSLEVVTAASESLPHPARQARFWRHELGVGTDGPLPDLVPLLESVGVQVVVARLGEDHPHGACALVPVPPELVRAQPARDDSLRTKTPRQPTLRIPFVFVNNGHRAVALQRFALAHGFAHLALGHGEAYDERIDWSGRSRRETDANAFAEEFVAPASAVVHWFETTGEASERIDAGTIVRLANHFGVSFWVARYRARAAGYLTSPTQLKHIDHELRVREWTTIPRQLFLGGQRDTLSVLTAEARAAELMGSDDPRLLRIAPLGTRVPGPMRAAVLQLIERGFVDVGEAAGLSEAARWLRHSPASLSAQLEQAGLE